MQSAHNKPLFHYMCVRFLSKCYSKHLNISWRYPAMANFVYEAGTKRMNN